MVSWKGHIFPSFYTLPLYKLLSFSFFPKQIHDPPRFSPIIPFDNHHCPTQTLSLSLLCFYIEKICTLKMPIKNSRFQNLSRKLSNKHTFVCFNSETWIICPIKHSANSQNNCKNTHHLCRKGETFNLQSYTYVAYRERPRVHLLEGRETTN